MQRVIGSAVLLVALAGACSTASQSGDPEVRATPESSERQTENSPSSAARTTDGNADGAQATGQDTEDLELEEIMRAIDEAKTPEERAQAMRRWDEWDSGPETVAADPRRELIDWAQAVSWWPHLPLLRSERVPNDTAPEEVVFALSQTGGRQGDPASEFAAVEVYYQYPPNTVDQGLYFDVVDGGGLTVTVEYIPDEYGGFVDAFPDEDARLVTVRGRSAMMITRRQPEANVDWRVVRWREAAPSGGVLRWSVGNHPDRYTDEQTIAFIDGLVEMGS